MIYKNFLIFIIAVVLLTVAPSESNHRFSDIEDLLSILVLMIVFIHFNRISFSNLRKKFEESDPEDSGFKKIYNKRVEKNSFVAIIFFTLELYIFDLKPLILSLFSFINFESISLILILSVFLIHLSTVWYWGYKSSGDRIGLSRNEMSYVQENIRFNLVILIPWIILIILSDIIKIMGIFSVEGLSFFPAGILLIVAFLLIFLIFSPGIIVGLWNCTEMGNSSLKDSILDFTKKEKVEFKKIMEWNSFGGSLITAAVLGFFKKTRYLLITPGLIKMLNREEIIAVISHEVGHVKKKHILYYFLLFTGFIIIGGQVITLIQLILLKTGPGTDLMIYIAGGGTWDLLNIMTAMISIFIFIVYFRYIFGYFMRNFEREADLNALESGIDPVSLKSAFLKIRTIAGSEKKGSNWHHFTIDERIDFLEKSSKNISLIKKHKKKIRLATGIYASVLILFTGLSVSHSSGLSFKNFESEILLKILTRKIEKNPANPKLYAAVAAIDYESGNWSSSRIYYEKSLELDPNQPEVLNNLAWLLVTCEDKEVRSVIAGLRYAKRAIRLKKSPHIYDTLAESYYSNEKFKEAFRSSYMAYRTARGNYKYYRKQLKKMKKMFELSKKSFKL